MAMDFSKLDELNKLLGVKVFNEMKKEAAKELPPVPLRPDYVPKKEEPKAEPKKEVKPSPKAEAKPQKQPPILVEDSPIIEGRGVIQQFKNRPETNLGNSVRENYNKVIDENIAAEEAGMARSEKLDGNADSTRKAVVNYAQKTDDVTNESRNNLKSDRGFMQRLALAQLKLAANPPTMDEGESYGLQMQKQLNQKMSELEKSPKDLSTMDKLIAAFGPGLLALAGGEAGAKAGVAAFKTSQEELDKAYKTQSETLKSKREALGKEIEGTGKILSAEAEKRKSDWQVKKDIQQAKADALKAVGDTLKGMNDSKRAQYIAELNQNEIIKSLLSGDYDMSKAGANLQFQREKETNDNFTSGVDKYADVEDKALARANDLAKAKVNANKPKSLKSADPFEREMKLRKEFESRAGIKNFNEVVEAYRKVDVAAKAKTAAGDMSLIFAYMKMLDPGSTVREGEYAQAEQTRGIPESVIALYNKAVSGEKLGDEQRDSFAIQAKSMAKIHAMTRKQIETQFANIAKESGVNPRQVFDPLADEILQPKGKPGDVKIIRGIKIQRQEDGKWIKVK